MLYNEKTFYPAFTHDVLAAKKEVIIYSPFVSKYRIDLLGRTLAKLKINKVEVFIFTRPVDEYSGLLQAQTRVILRHLEDMGVCIFYLSGSIHEKVAIIDSQILWEGSLNILSQRDSKEMMRRTLDEEAARQVISYLGINELLAEGYKSKHGQRSRGLVIPQRRSRRSKLSSLFLGLIPLYLIWWLFLYTLGIILMRSN